MVNVKTISIIVVTLNEAAHIQQLMSSIDRLERPSDLALETILIDGGSTDGTADAAHKADFAKLIVIEGASIPACRNRGLAEARGKIIAFLDGDCEPARDWLVNALPHLEGTDPVIIGWPVKPPTPGTWVQRAWHTHWMFKNRAATSNEPVREEAFRLITTRNMLLTRSTADQLGGFDEHLPTGEDTDFVFRAYAKGIRVLGVPSLCVTHHGEPSTLGDFFRQQLWHANKSSYAKIMNTPGTRAGRNAVIFSWAYALSFVLCLLAIPAAVLIPKSAWALTLPLIALLLGPAVLIALRAGNPVLIPALTALYGAYGLARTLDLLGLGRDKRSWKTTARAADQKPEIGNRKSQ
jgi:glycosyltransferase involved in cell wall biosynthesis